MLLIGANNLLDDPTAPIIWRGSLISNLVKTLYSTTIFNELDVLLIDMPPGTGDVALTIFQMLPVDDLIIITSPQDLVSMIVTKALKMANMMHINVLGVIENMSYYKCPDCGKELKVFGESHLEDFARQMNFDILAKLPLNSDNTELVDKGMAEFIDLPEINSAVEAILKEEK